MKVERDDIYFQGLVTFANLPVVLSDTFAPSDTTPSVSNRTVWKASGGVVTITNFDGGADAQNISIIGDGTTTIKNNTNIVTNTGADILLTSNLVYRFTYLKSTQKWYMDK